VSLIAVKPHTINEQATAALDATLRDLPMCGGIPVAQSETERYYRVFDPGFAVFAILRQGYALGARVAEESELLNCQRLQDTGGKDGGQ
jgi:hypothetical protein